MERFSNFEQKGAFVNPLAYTDFVDVLKWSGIFWIHPVYIYLKLDRL